MWSVGLWWSLFGGELDVRLLGDTFEHQGTRPHAMVSADYAAHLEGDVLEAHFSLNLTAYLHGIGHSGCTGRWYLETNFHRSPPLSVPRVPGLGCDR